jgi:galactokinase
MATGVLFQALTGFKMSGPDMALVGQAAENKFVGVSTGIMDQFVSRNGQGPRAVPRLPQPRIRATPAGHIQGQSRRL